MINSHLEIRGLTKNPILNDLNFSLQRGEIHMIFCLNGVGKTLLIKLLSGSLKADSGSILYFGEKSLTSDELVSNGISIIYDEPLLCDNATVCENITMSKSLKPWIYSDKQFAQGSDILKQLKFNISPNQKVKNLNYTQKRIVELARVVFQQPKVIILDEPFWSISDEILKPLIDVFKSLKKAGTSILIASQHFGSVHEICDRISIMSNGKILNNTISFHGTYGIILGAQSSSNTVDNNEIIGDYIYMNSDVGSSATYYSSFSCIAQKK